MEQRGSYVGQGGRKAVEWGRDTEEFGRKAVKLGERGSRTGQWGNRVGQGGINLRRKGAGRPVFMGLWCVTQKPQGLVGGGLGWAGLGWELNLWFGFPFIAEDLRCCGTS